MCPNGSISTIPQGRRLFITLQDSSDHAELRQVQSQKYLHYQNHYKKGRLRKRRKKNKRKPAMKPAESRSLSPQLWHGIKQECWLVCKSEIIFSNVTMFINVDFPIHTVSWRSTNAAFSFPPATGSILFYNPYQNSTSIDPPGKEMWLKCACFFQLPPLRARLLLGIQ